MSSLISKKKYVFVIIFIMIGVCLVKLCVLGSGNTALVQWGKYLSTAESDENVSANQSGDMSDIYMIGNSTNISNHDMEVVKNYYILGGQTAEDAENMAIDYLQKRNALYDAAIKNGYSVTEEEIDTYLEELKSNIASAENKDEVYAIIDQFDSEEDYWNYEKGVYQINLPIQKYVSDLETEYYANGGENWDAEYEKIKTDLVQAQNYVLSDGNTDLAE